MIQDNEKADQSIVKEKLHKTELTVKKAGKTLFKTIAIRVRG